MTPEDRIYETLTRALLDGQLPPGMKLGEERLATVFGVSRERVRKVLQRLGHEKRLTLIRNRGAYVPKPTRAEAREVYIARRTLEAGVIAGLLTRPTDKIVAQLRRHIERERAAIAKGDRAQSIKLSGAFHLLLVDLLENAELSRFVRELVERSSMLVSLYEPQGLSACAVDEHDHLVDAIEANDLAGALKAADDHLGGVEGRLVLEPPDQPEPDLETLFARPRRRA